jgi:hypothetical protein
MRITQGFANPFDIEDWGRRNFAFLHPGMALPVVQIKGQAARKSAPRAPRKKARSGIFVSSDEGSDDSDDNDDTSSLVQEEQLNKKSSSRKTSPEEATSETASPSKASLKKASEKTGTAGAKKTELPAKAASNIGSKQNKGQASVQVHNEEQLEATSEQTIDENGAPMSKKRKETPEDVIQYPLKKTKSLPVATKESEKSAPSKAPKDPKALTSIAATLSPRQEESVQVLKPAKSSETARTVFGNNEDDAPARRTRKSTDNKRIYTPSHIQ